MTLDSAAVTFRLEDLLSNLTVYKNSEKELFSVIKVLEELNKERKRMQKTVEGRKNFRGVLEKIDIEKILENIQEKINISGDKRLVESLRKNGKS